MNNRLDKLRLERDELEAQLLELERLEQARQQQEQLRLLTEPGAALPQATEPVTGIAALLRRLGTVNTELAVLGNSAPPRT